jgi:hypothetical protein
VFFLTVITSDVIATSIESYSHLTHTPLFLSAFSVLKFCHKLRYLLSCGGGCRTKFFLRRFHHRNLTLEACDFLRPWPKLVAQGFQPVQDSIQARFRVF